jgi:hypothetical protein
MIERVNSKRVLFPETKQKAFLLRIEKRLRLPPKKIAELLKIHPRTFGDWKREKFSMPLAVLKTLSQKTRIKIPSYIEIRDPFWYASKGGKIGGQKTYQKYHIIGGDPEKRKIRWKEWWEKRGKFLEIEILKRKFAKIPKKSAALAEFTGIVLGDGSISKRQIIIFLNYKDEGEYALFVAKLCKKLFGIVPTISRNMQKSTYAVVLSRTTLVNFCEKDLGLKIGDKIKHQIDVPTWIKRSKKFSIACVRGLIDTDGSVIKHKYKSKNKYYNYKKIGFTNRSLPLLKFTNKIFNKLDIKNRFMGEYDIRIENRKDVDRYFNLVGTHNPKNWQRYIK